MEILHKIWVNVLAGILGWVFISLPKVASKSMTWIMLLSSVGLAGVVGFVSGSLITYFFPNTAIDAVAAISAILGASCNHFMERMWNIADMVADKIEDQIDPDHNDKNNQTPPG